MKLFYLDNERNHLVIMAKDKNEAWDILKERYGILPYGTITYDIESELYESYHDLEEVQGPVAEID